MKNVQVFILFSLMLFTFPSLAFSDPPFIIGVAPHTSPRIILEMYAPLRLHLENALGIPVELVTAPDFDLFLQRGLDREFDLAVTTGHQARLLQLDAHYIPIMTYNADFKAVVLVRAGEGVYQLSDFNAQKILGLSRVSLVTLWGEHWLEKNGLNVKSIKYVSASDSLAQLIVAGEAGAGFTSLANFQKLNPDLQKKLKIFAESETLAGRIYVLNNRRAKMKAQVESSLWSYAETPEAKQYFATCHLGGYRLLKPGELEAMDRYATEARKLLNKNK